MIPITLGLTASEARVQPPWHVMPFPQSRMPASIEFSIKLFVCLSVCLSVCLRFITGHGAIPMPTR
jgi:hypothetical protein